MAALDFWDDPTRANKVVTELKRLRARLEPVQKASQLVEDAEVLWEMAEEADDEQTRGEVHEQVTVAQRELDRLETVSMLSGPYDERNCYLSIYAREGGTEAQDWTEMLMRMYLYYCERQGWKIEEIDKTPGEEVTLKLGGQEQTYRIDSVASALID